MKNSTISRINKIWLIIFLAILTMCPSLIAQSFTELDTDLAGVWLGTAIWGDYDNDDDLDIFLAGRDSFENSISKIYRNDGNGIFKDINANLIGVSFCAADWGDYDNDGDLDLLLAGENYNSSTLVTKIYRNDENGIFTDINVNLIGVRDGSLAWGDFDNDGVLDILLTGQDSSKTRLAIVYRNNGNGDFVKLNANLIGISGSSAEWGDYDNDGDLDILYSGWSSADEYVSTVYRNDGNGVFENIKVNLAGVSFGSVAWGDYDCDGDLDILISGGDNEYKLHCNIYRNDGDEVFTKIDADLVQAAGEVAWGDYDNDGYLDILFIGDAGSTGPVHITKVYQNKGDDVFVDTEENLTYIRAGSACWGDYDNDGDLDILLVGQDSYYKRISKIYRNDRISLANNSPTFPEGLETIVRRNMIIFNWHRSSDEETPSPGLTYNLRLGKSAGGEEIVPSMANNSNGYRKIAAKGNVCHDTIWTIKNLPDGKYYWSVQAVDNNFSGSAFALEKNFTISQEDFPSIISVKDIEGDQGLKVRVTWKASTLDNYKSNQNLISTYSVWRLNLNDPEMRINKTIKNIDALTAIDSLRSDTKHRRKNNLHIMNSSENVWDYIVTVPAIQIPRYSYVAPTLQDSTENGTIWNYFMVIAHTDNINNFYESEIDSGFSIDNIVPQIPNKLTIVDSISKVELSWISAVDPDLSYYEIYRSEEEGFEPIPDLLIGQTEFSHFIDTDIKFYRKFYYRVASVDDAINRTLSDEVAVTPIDFENIFNEIPTEFSLNQCYPNPFNAFTNISYQLPSESMVEISIYNMLGQKVALVVSENQPGGKYEIQWDASGFSSGVYYYLMTADNFEQARKMVFLK